MGLFDKKNCDICGDKIGLLGNRKLDNGNLCKNCAGKLSPWFEERRHSTVKTSKDSWHTEKKIKMLYVILESLVNFPQTDTMYLSTITKACLLWHLI